MRKLLMFVALVLGMVSCQNYLDDFDVNIGGEKEVVVSVSLPEGTRANSAVGAISNEVVKSDEYTLRYIFQIWDEAKQQKKDAVVEYSDDTTISFPVRLVPGRNYRFVVWADVVREGKKEDLHYNTANFPTISVNTDSWVAMDETRDAYTTSELITDFGSAQNYTLTLKRPFAKLRVITTDMDELMGVVPTTATVTYTTEYYNTFNALDSKAVRESKNENKEHKDYTIKEYELTNGKVLFTDYFFAENDAVSFNLSVNMSDNGEPITRYFNTDIPVNRNHLTTLIGNILTEGDNIEVKIEEGFDGEYEYPYNDGTRPTNYEIWYTSTDGKVVTPFDVNAFGANIISNTYYDGKGIIRFDREVTKIDKWAFGWCRTIESILIPDSVTEIKNQAFIYCDNLNSINITLGIKYIGNSAFYGSKLQSIDIPNSDIVIESGAFAGCNYLTKFIGKFSADDGRCLIDNDTIIAYAGGSGSTYTIPNNVTKIGYGAFSGCNITSITIPNNVISIGESSFQNCGGLTSVTINDGVTSIERDAFYNCSDLTDVDLGKSVEYIGPQAFCYCRSLETITIPESVISIEVIAFYGCDNLKSIYCQGLTPPNKNNSSFLGEKIDNCSIYVYNESVNAYKTAWAEYADIISGFGPYEGTETTTIYYSTSNWWEPIENNYLPIKENEYSSSSNGIMVVYGILRNIPENAFAYCSDLRSIVIPDSVVHISYCAFAWCFGLKNVTIPESVTSIGSYAFHQCESLDSVYCKCTTPPSLDYSFTSCPSSLKIYVPHDVVDTYKSAEGWNAYADNIIGYDFQ